MIHGMMTPRVNKPTRAVWWLKSEQNRRWNVRGAFIYKGMRGIPLEADYKVQELRLKYHVNPPIDLEWGIKLGGFNYFMVKFFGRFYFGFFRKLGYGQKEKEE